MLHESETELSDGIALLLIAYSSPALAHSAHSGTPSESYVTAAASQPSHFWTSSEGSEVPDFMASEFIISAFSFQF
jgi:hypothetical protein